MSHALHVHLRIQAEEALGALCGQMWASQACWPKAAAQGVQPFQKVLLQRIDSPFQKVLRQTVALSLKLRLLGQTPADCQLQPVMVRLHGIISTDDVHV